MINGLGMSNLRVVGMKLTLLHLDYGFIITYLKSLKKFLLLIKYGIMGIFIRKVMFQMPELKIEEELRDLQVSTH